MKRAALIVAGVFVASAVWMVWELVHAPLVDDMGHHVNPRQSGPRVIR